jgi:DNA polymerase alpha subunit A
VQTTPEKEEGMEIEGRVIPQLKFHELKDEVMFYLTDVYAFTNKLFISGVLASGQTINLVATQPLKELYFCLKSEYSDMVITEERKAQAKREIDLRLRQNGIRDFTSDFVEKEYVFELEGIPRERRPYYQIRYPFKIDAKEVKEEPRPDWEGETYKYVFGTTYTPLELFIVNTGIKGPEWVKVEKQFLRENSKNVECGLCADIQDAELIESMRDSARPPNMRVMSISIKAVVPAQVKVKKLFNTNRVDELHIYAISYFLCEDYQVELKPSKYMGSSRTLYLKEFGTLAKDKNFIVCNDERHMIAQFQADLRKYDPDVLVCHDSSRILDTLIQRMAKLSDKQDRPRLGRLVHLHELNKSNQQQRINSTIAGRLLVDTFIHAKDMIKSVDYELESMAQHIRPERAFQGMSDEETLHNLNSSKTQTVILKAREEAEVTFALMNHLEILQITRQLSNICGNSWKRSLEIQRAERNEYLIMHECISRGLIIPDKFRRDKNSEEEEETDKKKYQGGHVLDPLKGFYKDFILLLDFNSLYPSIIREYNVCFSVIKRPLVPLTAFYRNKDRNAKKEKEKVERAEEPMEMEEMEVVPPPKEECSKEKWGFLPTLIDKIVDRRKKCKKAMKTATPEKCIILDIQQKCYKLVANSIYGCLGFSISRFYSKHLAALITRMGREALLRAKDIVGAMGGVRVIYGDTDSLMIQPHGLEKDDDREKLF